MPQSDFQDFARSLCDPAQPPPGALRVPAGIDVHERFAVYRNNVHVSLVDALADRFPVVQALVGEEFFHAAARDHVRSHKPASPVLAEFGDDFPAFLDTHEAAAVLPFLADVAQLERDWTRCWAAADEAALDRGGIARLTPARLAAARLRPHAAARLVRSPWPVADLWQAHQRANPDLSTLEWRGQDVLITRPGAEVRLQCLEAGAACMAQALFDGQCVGEAAARAAGVEAGAVLGLLIDSGMFAEVLLP